MFKFIKKMSKKTAATTLLASISATNAMAGLPTMDEPTRGNGKGIMATIQNHTYDAVIFAGLGISAIAFLTVASSLISGYKEVQDGKKKWGDLGMSALVGAVLLVLMIWLLTESTKIL